MKILGCHISVPAGALQSTATFYLQACYGINYQVEGS